MESSVYPSFFFQQLNVYSFFWFIFQIQTKKISSLIVQSSSSLSVAERLCLVVIPFIAMIEVLISTVSGCFECQRLQRPKKIKCIDGDLARLAGESRCIALFPFVLIRASSFSSIFWFLIRYALNFLLQLLLMKWRHCSSCLRSWVVQLSTMDYYTR